VLIIQHLPLDTTLALGDFSTLFLPVVGAVFLLREVALLAAQSLVLFFEVEPIHRLPV